MINFTGNLTDKEVKKAFNELKEYFRFTKNTYIKFDGFYIELRYQENSSGIRWFHRKKYKVEVVFNRESGPDQNVSGWVLFSKFDDAVLHAVLSAESEIRRLDLLKKKDGTK